MNFFNKKNKLSIENREEKTRKSLANNKRLSKVSFALVGLIGASAVGGSATAIWYAATNYTASSEFYKSYNLKYDFDNALSGDPTHPRLATDVNQDMIDNAIKAQSAYLENKEIDTYYKTTGKYSEEPGDNNYLNLTIPNQKIKCEDARSDDDGKQIDLDPMSSYFDNMVGNNITMIIDLDTSKDVTSLTDKTLTSFVNTNELIPSKANVAIPKTNKETVNIKLGDVGNEHVEWHDFLNNNFISSGTSVSDGDTATPEIYILRDQYSFISKMYSILQIYVAHTQHYDSIGDTYSYENAYHCLSLDEINWAKAVLGNDTTTNIGEMIGSTNIVGAGSASEMIKSGTTAEGITPASTQLFYNSADSNDKFFYRMIEAKKYSHNTSGYVDLNSLTTSGDGATAGTVGWDWMKPYVVGIVTKDNIKNYFPNKDPLDTTSKADDENIGKNLLLGSNDSKAKTDFGQFEANQLKNSLIGKYNTQLVYQPTIDLAQTPFNGSNGTAKIVSDIDGIKINGSIFSKGIFGTSPLLSCIIALAAVILVIGIIISVLYRIPGFFAFIAGLLTVSLTILFMVLSSHAISFGMLLGVFGGIIITALSVFSFMERIRKHMVKDTVVTSGIKKGIARGILQVLDYHVVGVICGMCFLFFGSITIYELGLTLLLYSLVSVVSFILWGFCMYTTLNNKANLTKTSLLFPTFMFKATSIKETAAEERIMNEHKYETSYITYRKFPKFNLFGMKKEIISVVAICLVSLAGIILFFTFGGNFEVSLSKNSLGSVLNSVIISFAIAMGIIAAYSFIRLNWTSAIPVAISLIVVTLLTISLFIICQVTVSPQTLEVLAFIYFISGLFVISYVGNINNKWIKSKAFGVKELRSIINLESISMIRYWLTTALATILSGTIFMLLFASTSVMFDLLLMIVGILVSLVVVLSVTKSILLWFIIARYRYVQAVSQNEFFFQHNFDKIDEQSIDGINKFKRIKITL